MMNRAWQAVRTAMHHHLEASVRHRMDFCRRVIRMK